MGVGGLRGVSAKWTVKKVSRILLGQAKCPGSHEWVPYGASPSPEVDVPVLGGGEDVGDNPPPPHPAPT